MELDWSDTGVEMIDRALYVRMRRETKADCMNRTVRIDAADKPQVDIFYWLVRGCVPGAPVRSPYC
jgi:hypothetical protein